MDQKSYKKFTVSLAEKAGRTLNLRFNEYKVTEEEAIQIHFRDIHDEYLCHVASFYKKAWPAGVENKIKKINQNSIIIKCNNRYFIFEQASDIKKQQIKKLPNADVFKI